MPTPSPTPSDLIAVAAMIFGFGIVVIMFRVQRELWVQEHHPEWRNWIPWADWLIFASVLLAGCLTIFPLLAFPVTRSSKAIAAASCGSAILLQIGYVPAILAHYRIFFGRKRATDHVPREPGEPAEKVSVILTAVIAVLAFAFVFCQQH
jgi:hypothetical protein